MLVAGTALARTALEAGPDPVPPAFDARVALQASQDAIGRSLPADLAFTDQDGRRRTLGEFRGKPLVISPVYTSCFGVCPTTTTYLRKIVDMSRGLLGAGSFSVLTIGFDAANDTPGRMREFAQARGIQVPGWVFGAADAGTVRLLLDRVGFTFVPSPRGFDHMVQATVVDGSGAVYRQVYGQEFQPQLLVDPLKRLALGQRAREDSLEAMIEGVRLFCTVYDPASGRYRFDWSLPLSFAIGVLCLAAVAVFLWRSWRQSS